MHQASLEFGCHFMRHLNRLQPPFYSLENAAVICVDHPTLFHTSMRKAGVKLSMQDIFPGKTEFKLHEKRSHAPERGFRIFCTLDIYCEHALVMRNTIVHIAGKSH